MNDKTWDEEFPHRESYDAKQMTKEFRERLLASQAEAPKPDLAALALKWLPPKPFQMRDDRYEPVDLNYESRKACESALRELEARLAAAPSDEQIRQMAAEINTLHNLDDDYDEDVIAIIKRHLAKVGEE